MGNARQPASLGHRLRASSGAREAGEGWATTPSNPGSLPTAPRATSSTGGETPSWNAWRLSGTPPPMLGGHCLAPRERGRLKQPSQAPCGQGHRFHFWHSGTVKTVRFTKETRANSLKGSKMRNMLKELKPTRRKSALGSVVRNWGLHFVRPPRVRDILYPFIS